MEQRAGASWRSEDVIYSLPHWMLRDVHAIDQRCYSHFCPVTLACRLKLLMPLSYSRMHSEVKLCIRGGPFADHLPARAFRLEAAEWCHHSSKSCTARLIMEQRASDADGRTCPCRFGFVAFEKKEDCQRAFAMCGKNMFLIGNSARPVIVEMARTEVTARHDLELL